MAVDINWGLLTPPGSVAQNAFAGFQQGQQIQAQRAQQVQQQRVQSALSGYASDPDSAINNLISAGAVQQASALSGLRDQQRTRANQQAAGTAIAGAYNPDGTIDASKLGTAARNIYASGDLATGNAVQNQVATLNTEQRAAAQRASEAAGKVAAVASNMDGEAAQRAYVQQNRAALIGEGVPATEIDGGLALPQGQFGSFLNGVVAHAQSLGDILKGQQSDAELDLKKSAQAETAKHDRAEEGIGATNARANVSRAGTAAFSAQTGRMSYEARKKAGGFGTPGVGSGGGAGTDDAPPD